MPTQPIYHTLGLDGYDFLSSKMDGGRLFLHITPQADLICCPVCSNKNVIRKGVCTRNLKHIPIGKNPTIIKLDVPRVYCRNCGLSRRIKINIAEPRKGYTIALNNYVIELSKMMTIKDIALHYNLGWDCVKEIIKTNLYKCFGDISFSDVEYIAIDEISIRRGHKYITLVMDIKKGNVIFVGDGKGADALIPFWEKINESECKLKAISTDLGEAYISSVIDNAKGVKLVFDHFHLIKLVNDTLTVIRRGLYNEYKDKMHKNVIKGTRWILLKNPENLSEKYDEPRRLKEALEMNHPLSYAYYMKEEFRQIWKQPDKITAEKFIDSWILNAWASGIGPLMKLGNTLAAFKFGILNWYDYPISSGKIEGTNNKIKVLKRNAYGYRDMEFFKLRIMAIHEAKYGLTG